MPAVDAVSYPRELVHVNVAADCFLSNLIPGLCQLDEYRDVATSTYVLASEDVEPGHGTFVASDDSSWDRQ